MSNIKRLVVLLLTFMCLSLTYAKPLTPADIQHKADSLRSIITTRQGEERAAVFRELFKLYFANNQVEPAYIVLDELIALEQDLKQPEREASARWNKIALLNNSGRYEMLLDEAETQMKWFKDHQMWDRYYQIWQRKCSANHDLRRLQSAMREARAMQEDAQRRKNNIGRAMSYKQIGSVYYDIRELQKATEAFEHSAALLVEEHDSTGMLSGVYEGLCQSLDGRGLYEEELATAQKTLEDAQKVLDEATDKAFANIDEETDAILASLADGADWDALMEEKNQDPGMASNPMGYAVAEGMTGFDQAFVDAAMAIDEIGKYSDKVRGNSYGYYIIRYDSDVPEGPVALDDVKDTISSNLLATKQNNTYNETLAKWVEEAGIKVDLNALKD